MTSHYAESCKEIIGRQSRMDKRLEDALELATTLTLELDNERGIVGSLSNKLICLQAEVEELKEFKWMYEELCK